jgi:biopolymer transport protein ExbD
MLAYLPKDDSKGAATSTDIKPTIRVRVEGSKNRPEFIINDEPVKKQFIASRLLTASGGDTDTPVTISPAPTIYFDHVLYVLDQCAVADMKKVSFAAKF